MSLNRNGVPTARLTRRDQVLQLEAVDGVEPLSERALRIVAHAGNWAEQRAAWRVLLG
ncbi:MAG: hypothetical protein ACJ8AT_12470 [Hyalangium sp.]|uniref:hypothetical protein n=1 Tax=Hyalangium sp. TaxID=2028555 RepID=UPI00389AFCCA